jgi:hypothetical protein
MGETRKGIAGKGYGMFLMTGRYLILDNDDGFPLEKHLTPNLTANERKIKILSAKECPIHSVCVNLTSDHISSICKYFGLFENIKGPILCDHGEYSTRRELVKLESEPPCIKMRPPIIPTSPLLQPEKSHAYVVCDD